MPQDDPANCGLLIFGLCSASGNPFAERGPVYVSIFQYYRCFRAS